MAYGVWSAIYRSISNIVYFFVFVFLFVVQSHFQFGCWRWFLFRCKYVIPVSLHLQIYIRSIIWNLVNWIAIFDLYRFIMPPTATATATSRMAWATTSYAYRHTFIYLANLKMVSRDFYANQIIRLFCSLLLMHCIAYTVALSFIIQYTVHTQSVCVAKRHAKPRIYYLNVRGTFAIKWRWNYTNSNELPNDHVWATHTHTYHEPFKTNKAIKSYYFTTSIGVHFRYYMLLLTASSFLAHAFTWQIFT